jgi:hypothetical protein
VDAVTLATPGPVGAVTLATPGPVDAVTLATPGPVGAVTLATPGPVGAVTPITAAPVTGARAALVKNGTGPGLAVTFVTAAAIVGVMPVTTVVLPGVPLMPVTALAKVGLTLVTHVAADAEDTSAVLRLPTVSAARRDWFEADANSASKTAARRGTVVRFGLVIPAPHERRLPLSMLKCIAELPLASPIGVQSIYFSLPVASW